MDLQAVNGWVAVLATQSEELAAMAASMAVHEDEFAATLKREKDTKQLLEASCERNRELLLELHNGHDLLGHALCHQLDALTELGFNSGEFNAPLERLVGHLAMALDRNTDLLKRLPAWVITQLNTEGLSMSLAMAEYIMAYYGSSDAWFSLEPALEGIHSASAEEATMVRWLVHPAAQTVAQMFAPVEEAKDATPTTPEEAAETVPGVDTSREPTPEGAPMGANRSV